MANAKKPTALKILQGTNQKCRSNPDEPAVVSGGLIAPDYLTEIQVERFQNLAATVGEIMLVAGRSDSDALAQLVICLDAIAIDNGILSDPDIGRFVKKDNGDTVAHPATRTIISNQQRAQALMNEFGLTPASRSKVSAGPKPKENKFAALNGKRA